jgi:hypothetical protein
MQMTAEATQNGDSGTPGHGQKSRLHEKAIAALLTASNVADAAKAAGESRETLPRWLRVITDAGGFPRKTYWTLPAQSYQPPGDVWGATVASICAMQCEALRWH